MQQRARRLLRFLAGRDHYPRIDLRCRTLRLGSTQAGWTVAPERLDRASVVYCVGIGEDISFDLALHARFGMPIHAFDPTPRSLRWVRSQVLPDGYQVHDCGLGDADEIVSFRPPADPSHVSHRMVADGPAAEAGIVRAQVHRLETIRRMLGHDRVDLLKMDIEGAEYAVIADLQRSPVVPRQLLVEFHHRFPGIGIARTRDAIARLRGIGYRLFHVSPNGEECAFLREEAASR